jgi:sugar phosphate isomerase/epimerase
MIQTQGDNMQIGFHTDAFNSSYWSFEQCLDWGQRNGIHFIECGTIDGVSWIHGLGYQPHVALWQDPLLLRRKMEKQGLEFSQLDAAFPLSLPEGASLGVEYVLHTIRWAKLAGCPRVDTTDDRSRPAGMSDREGLDHMRRIYRQIVPVAEAYRIVVNIEPHGYYTTKPDFMAEMLGFCDSPFLRMNMDTGQHVHRWAGSDRLHRTIPRQHQSRARQGREPEPMGVPRRIDGIAVSHCAIGEGVNAENIRRSVALLASYGYDGVLSLECEGQGGPMIERSLEWLRCELSEIPAPTRVA